MRTKGVVVFAVLALTACSSGGGNNPPPPPPTGAIAVYNASGYTIHEVYVVPVTATTWGSQVNTSPVAYGSTFTAAGLAPGLWDERLISNGTTSRFEAFATNVQVVAGQTVSLTATASNFTGSMIVTNGNTTYSLTGLYVVPNSSTTWGSNWLTNALSYGQSFHIWGMPPDLYDVQCVHSDGGTSTGTYTVSSFSVMNVTCY